MTTLHNIIEIHQNPTGRQRVYQRCLARNLTLTQAAALHHELATLNPRTVYRVRPVHPE